MSSVTADTAETSSQNIQYCSSAAEFVCGYLALYPQEAEALQPLTAQLAALKQSDMSNISERTPAAHKQIENRKTLPGHITASGLVINGSSILMVFHPYLQKWLQPGGHIEEGETPIQACIREVLEETGLRTLPHAWHESNPQPFDINIHTIPANPKKQEPQHLHYDFRYLLRAENPDSVTESELAWQWQDRKAITEANLQNALQKLIFIS